jgi:stage II sporulation protein D
MSARVLLLIMFFLQGPLYGQERIMRIGLLRDRTVKNVVVMSAKGSCTIFADGVKKGEIAASDGLRIEVGQGVLHAKSLNFAFTAKKKIEIVPKSADGGFRLRSPDHKMQERKYQGTLEVQRNNGTLLLIDHVPLEAYTAGVVQAEAGKDHHIEYYKLQAVSCRTYALSNSRKHLPEGFQLCDGVHCQVYHGMHRHDSIGMAVKETRGLVLVDPQIKLIHSTFHSNCGGETVNAEDLWSKSESYLRATTDTFCLAAPHSSWSRTLTRNEWLGYLQKRHSFRTTDTAQLEGVLNYEPTCRDLYLGNTFPLVPLKSVREDLKLNSTYFSVTTEGDEVLLQGRGFGHGVGLCQEGSMKMARSGRSYTDILHHYYTDVHLVDLSNIEFFRE